MNNFRKIIKRILIENPNNWDKAADQICKDLKDIIESDARRTDNLTQYGKGCMQTIKNIVKELGL